MDPIETPPSSSEPSNSESSNSSSRFPKFGGWVEFDFPWIFGRLQEIMFNPKGCWTHIKSEALSPKELFSRYIIPLELLSTLCTLIGGVFIGINTGVGTYRVSLFDELIYCTFAFFANLAALLIGAFVIEKLAPKFETSVTFPEALRLVGFAATPGLLAGILGITPGFLVLLVMLFLGLYSIYLLWVGFQPLTKVSDTQKLPYFLTSFVCSTVLCLVIFSVTAKVFPAPVPQGEIKDYEDFQRNIQKMIPSSSR